MYWGDDANVKDIAAKCTAANTFSYGFGEGSDYKVAILSENEKQTVFTVHFKGQLIAEFTTPLAGRYNILNAAAAIAQAHIQKWPLEDVKKALATFQGVKRRQEILGEYSGVLLIEDFAHHPTAVKETIKAIQNKYKGHRVFSVFEPRSATSRRKVFQKDYVEAFSQAHEVLIAQAFDQGKIAEDNRFSTEELIDDLKHKNVSARLHASVDQIVSDLVQRSEKGDVILIMSNGGFDGIYQKLMTGLQTRA